VDNRIRTSSSPFSAAPTGKTDASTGQAGSRPFSPRDARDGSKSYRASVWSDRDRKRIRKTLPTFALAKAWRSHAARSLRLGELRPPERRRIEELAAEWLEGARAGLIRNRSGDPCEPSSIRGYERALRLRPAEVRWAPAV
jgi:hypothetical protein